jgi:AmiR/NasT family two-component response regulator
MPFRCIFSKIGQIHESKKIRETRLMTMTMRSKPPRWLVILTALTVPTLAFAYIDPGTGAYIVQGIASFAAIAAFYITRPVRLIKHLFRRRPKSDPSEP